MRATAVRRGLGVGMIVALAALAGCVTPPGTTPDSFTLKATTFHDLHQNEFYGGPFWDNDRYDEPYLIQLGFRFKLGTANSAHAFVASSYPSEHEICKAEDGSIPVGGGETRGPSVCPISAGMGELHFGQVATPDLLDLASGTPLELLGTVEIAMESDELFPGSSVQLWQGVAPIFENVLNKLMAEGGLPTDPQALIQLITDNLANALTSLGGIIGGVIGGLGDADDIIGVSLGAWVAVGGGLGNLLGGVLPGVIDLVNTALTSQPNSAFPNGLPITIGVLPYQNNFSLTFGNANAGGQYQFDYTMVH